jgi:hypothetical protein
MRLERMRPGCYALLLLVSACGGSIAENTAEGDAGARRDSGRDARARVEDAADAADTDDADAGFPVFHDDACPDAPSEPPLLECDPFATTSTQCRPGTACYPVTPRGLDPCNPGRYSTQCFPAGDGVQGTPCSDGSQCAGGFICVKTGAGDQCAKLCRTDQFGQCDVGRICRIVDVSGSGFGACD